MKGPLDIFDHISRNSSYSEKCFRRICREYQSTFYVRNRLLKTMPFMS